MKILLDECIDRRFAKELEGHEVLTVPQVCNNNPTASAKSAFNRVFASRSNHLAQQRKIVPRLTKNGQVRLRQDAMEQDCK